VLTAERQQMESVKQDVRKRVPGYMAEAAAENGVVTLTGETPRAGPGDGTAAADFGARAFGVKRNLELSFGPQESFDGEANRLFAVAWRRRALAGVAGYLFGAMAVPPGYALSSARAASGKNKPGEKLLAPDFRPGLVAVRMGEEDFDYFKRSYFFIAGKDVYADIAGRILH
jgi:hypothetical protein